ncbi:DNA (cytosine-5-)-methyltransferase [Micromonospora chersina]|uniref:DNA cytosine methyltransferase n=1 Tax=Micromonospora chersina TaxID=47854 RepID=UPI0033DE13A1
MTGLLPATAGTLVGLFAGIGGFEAGLGKHGLVPDLLCEWWSPAREVLRERFPAVRLEGDIRCLEQLPPATVVAAGFPCTDISQVGRTAGIAGNESGLVQEVFRLLERSSAKWVVLENVANMLRLHRGTAMHVITSALEAQGWRWAYRLVDSRSFGVPQRRQRVFLVASRNEDPRTILFADETEEMQRPQFASDAFGFYWTEGNRGVGWAQDAIPTLKGGSKAGIPSPPGVWIPEQPQGHAIVRPSIEAAEELQGFSAGWTAAASARGARWKLVGNAVTVGVADWLGRRLTAPRQPVDVPRRPHSDGDRWPKAAANVDGKREVWSLSEWPVESPYPHLKRLLSTHGSEPLSYGATNGFYTRLMASRLRADDEFKVALKEHIEATRKA